jgi:peroxiredoxin
MRLLAAGLLLAALALPQQKTVWSEKEQPIVARMKLRSLPDSERGVATRQLALDIRQLPPSANKLKLALNLAYLSTEGDFGRDTLQEVAHTLATALKQTPGSQPAYETLAQLVRYEGVDARLDSPQFDAAMKVLEENDRARERANFTLKDLDGNTWTLQNLQGKVVLVNFWATWCPPCRKEMPDLDELSTELKAKGLVVLAISNEEPQKVRAFAAEHRYRFPLLLDTDGNVSKHFRVEGIPKTFIYNRDGRLAAQSIDMRTRGQFMQLLAKAGL